MQHQVQQMQRMLASESHKMWLAAAAAATAAGGPPEQEPAVAESSSSSDPHIVAESSRNTSGANVAEELRKFCTSVERIALLDELYPDAAASVSK